MELLVAVSNTSDPTQGWKGYQLDDHRVWDFDMSSTAPDPVTVKDMNDAVAGDPAAATKIMNEFSSTGHITFINEYVKVRIIEPNLRWMVLCRLPPPDGSSGCNDKSRLVRNESNQLRVHDWPRLDFPTLGMDADNLYVGTQSAGTQAGDGAPLFVIAKERLRSGTPPALQDVTLLHANLASRIAQPINDLDGNTAHRALFVAAFDVPCHLSFYRIPGVPVLTAGSVFLKFCSSPPDAAHPGQKRSGAGTHAFITNSDHTLSSNVVLRNDKIHGVQTVNVDGAARLRYFRVNVEYSPPPTDSFRFNLLDDILVPAPPTPTKPNAFYPSLAVNENGQVVIGFTGSSGDEGTTHGQ